MPKTTQYTIVIVGPDTALETMTASDLDEVQAKLNECETEVDKALVFATQPLKLKPSLLIEKPARQPRAKKSPVPPPASAKAKNGSKPSSITIRTPAATDRLEP